MNRSVQLRNSDVLVEQPLQQSLQPSLQMTSLMSELIEPLCIDLARYLAKQIEAPIQFTTATDFPQRHQLLDQQSVEIAWICGLLYTMKASAPTWSYTPCVAPCMVGETAPVYYGELIVPKQSDLYTVEELRGRTWAYNEEESFSGFHMMRALLQQMGDPGPYFANRIYSGSHLNSLEMVRHGQIDAAIIDSTMMQMIGKNDPTLADDLRILTRIGPYSAPLLALSPHCSIELHQKVQDALTTMHQTELGSSLLTAWQIQHFAPVEDRTYDEIRQLMAETEHITL